jgi:hypothetical protein
MIKFLLLLPLIYLCATKYLYQDKVEREITGLKIEKVYVKKIEKLFSGTLTKSGSKENNLTAEQAEAVFYKNVSVDSLRNERRKNKPIHQPANKSNSLAQLVTTGFNDVADGRMPSNKNGFLLLLALAFCCYKAFSFLLSLISSPERVSG